MIGFYFLKDLLQHKIDVKFTYFKHKLPLEGGYFLDITNKKDTLKIIDNYNPDIVIHTVAITNVDLCEQNHDLANKINVQGTVNIIEGCKKNKSKLIFLSTSAVFNGSKSEYFENDITTPESYYGETKKNAEEEIKKSKLPHLIIRIDQPYFWSEEWQHSNSVLRVLDGLKDEKLFREVTDWYNTPTFIPDIILGIKNLIDLNCCGIYHVVGPDFINRFKLALYIAEIFELDKKKIMPITSNFLDLPAQRVNVNLNNEKFQKETKIIMKGVKEGLLSMIKNKK